MMIDDDTFKQLLRINDALMQLSVDRFESTGPWHVAHTPFPCF